jgi:hypothetical protein
MSSEVGAAATQLGAATSFLMHGIGPEIRTKLYMLPLALQAI